MRHIMTIIAAMGTLLIPNATVAKGKTGTLAECGPSTGQAYFQEPIQHQGWTTDELSTGAIAFRVDDSVPNVIHMGSFGTVDTKATGGDVVFTRFDLDKQEFGIAVLYQPSGTMETYTLTRLPNGKSRLLWTSNKAHWGPAGITKAAVYTAECN